MKKFRVPEKDEVIKVLNWGGYRLILTVPAIGLYTLRQLSRLALHVTTESERFYHQVILQPFDALIWGEPSELKVIEGEILSDSDFEKFSWSRFKTEPDTFPHIRIIGKSGMGKTLLAEYLLSILGGKQYVITPKKKPKDFQTVPVYGIDFNYLECGEKLRETKQEMYSRYEAMKLGDEPGLINFVLDEWRLIVKNVEAAKEDMKELATVARDAKIRMIALAQGEQVQTWGLEGESDIEECFTTIRLGEFALEYAKSLRAPKEVQKWLREQKRPCMVDRLPALVPDLSSFRAVGMPVCIQPSLESLKTPELSAEQVFQPLAEPPNRVMSDAEMLAWRMFRASNISESKFIKEVLGYTGDRYPEGRVYLENLKQRFGG